MALTRSMLKGMGLTEEQIGAIIDAHTETVNGLKADRDSFKAKVDDLRDIEKKYEELSKDDWKSMYDKEHKEYEDFKKSVSDKEKQTQIKSAYKRLLQDNKVGEKHIDAILRVTDFTKMELDAEGKLENEEKLVDSIKNDWSGFITTEQTKGAGVETPPNNSHGNSMTREQIMAIKDTSERQKAIAANVNLFRR